MTTYTQQYMYDAGTNLVSLKHQPNSGAATRQYQPVRTANNRQQTEQHDSVGNQLSREAVQDLAYNSDGSLAYLSWQDGGYQITEYYTYTSPGVRGRKVTEVRTLLTDMLIQVDTVTYLGEMEFRASYTGVNLSYDGDLVTDASGDEVSPTTQRTVTRVKDDHGQVGKIDKNELTSAQTIRYNVLNHLDSNELVLDEQGQLAHYRNYAPYGETLSETNADATESELGYSGQEEDATGLIYYGYRYYPKNGIWNRADPIKFESGQLNMYNLVNGNPVTNRDEMGLMKYFSNAASINRESPNDWLNHASHLELNLAAMRASGSPISNGFINMINEARVITRRKYGGQPLTNQNAYLTAQHTWVSADPTIGEVNPKDHLHTAINLDRTQPTPHAANEKALYDALYYIFHTNNPHHHQVQMQNALWGAKNHFNSLGNNNLTMERQLTLATLQDGINRHNGTLNDRRAWLGDTLPSGLSSRNFNRVKNMMLFYLEAGRHEMLRTSTSGTRHDDHGGLLTRGVLMDYQYSDAGQGTNINRNFHSTNQWKSFYSNRFKSLTIDGNINQFGGFSTQESVRKVELDNSVSRGFKYVNVNIHVNNLKNALATKSNYEMLNHYHNSIVLWQPAQIDKWARKATVLLINIGKSEHLHRASGSYYIGSAPLRKGEYKGDAKTHHNNVLSHLTTTHMPTNLRNAMWDLLEYNNAKYGLMHSTAWYKNLTRPATNPDPYDTPTLSSRAWRSNNRIGTARYWNSWRPGAFMEHGTPAVQNRQAMIAHFNDVKGTNDQAIYEKGFSNGLANTWSFGVQKKVNKAHYDATAHHVVLYSDIYGKYDATRPVQSQHMKMLSFMYKNAGNEARLYLFMRCTGCRVQTAGSEDATFVAGRTT